MNLPFSRSYLFGEAGVIMNLSPFLLLLLFVTMTPPPAVFVDEPLPLPFPLMLLDLEQGRRIELFTL